jgi:hypothetical protein
MKKFKTLLLAMCAATLASISINSYANGGDGYSIPTSTGNPYPNGHSVVHRTIDTIMGETDGDMAPEYDSECLKKYGSLLNTVGTIKQAYVNGQLDEVNSSIEFNKISYGDLTFVANSEYGMMSLAKHFDTPDEKIGMLQMISYLTVMDNPDNGVLSAFYVLKPVTPQNPFIVHCLVSSSMTPSFKTKFE